MESETFVVPETVEHRHAGESVFVEFRLGLLLTWEELLCAMRSHTRELHYRAVHTCLGVAEASYAWYRMLRLLFWFGHRRPTNWSPFAGISCEEGRRIQTVLQFLADCRPSQSSVHNLRLIPIRDRCRVRDCGCERRDRRLSRYINIQLSIRMGHIVVTSLDGIRRSDLLNHVALLSGPFLNMSPAARIRAKGTNP